MNLTWTKTAARIERLEGALALLSQAMHAINDLGECYAETDEEVDELVDIQRRLARIRRRYQERRRRT